MADKSAPLSLLLAAALAIPFVLLFACGEGGRGKAGGGENGDGPPLSELEVRLDKALKLNKRMGCTACHGIDEDIPGAARYRGLFGTEVELQDGTRVVRDENYIRLAILQPNAQVPKGSVPAMPSYESRLTLDEVDLLVDLIKHLAETADAPGDPKPGS